MFNANGKLHYDDTDKLKLIVEINRDFSDYYRSLIPKNYKIQRQKWDCHISVIRHEVPPLLRYWDKYEGEIIYFSYDNYIHYDKNYFWLNVWCTRLEDIRTELGLPNYSKYTLPPSGFNKCFHCTIGNTKNERK